MPWPWSKQAASGTDQAQADEQAKKETEAFIGELMSKFEEKLIKPLRDEVGTLNQRWAKLEEAATQSSEENNHGAAGEKKELTAEEKGEFERQKLLAVTIATNARITESEVLREVEDKFSNFIPKIKEHLAQTPLERKAMADYPQYCRNVVKMVIGGAALDGGLKFDTGTNKFFLEDTASSGAEKETYDFLNSELTWTDPRSGRTLTPLQQLQKLGIKPDDFAKSVKAGAV